MTQPGRIAILIARSALALAIAVALSLAPISASFTAHGAAHVAQAGEQHGHHGHAGVHGGATAHHGVASASDHECCAPADEAKVCLAFCLQACSAAMCILGEPLGEVPAASGWRAMPSALHAAAGPEATTPPPKTLV